MAILIPSTTVLSESLIQTVSSYLSLLFQFLRAQNIAHMDLKPQNILLQGQILKLADFGFAQHLSPGI